uniref:Integrase core domain-containing protein n=1 Tax=Candidatus Kentrum sp. LPFa TaxID=2126335 RepID=A0A450W4V6_9GAMM|nr:MAG: Integrase core domain-containing protein [Candidatus Kentron sp. LPFa]
MTGEYRTMPTTPPQSAIVEYWMQTARRLLGAAPGERARLVQAAADTAGCSVNTAYRRLKEYAGYTSGRRRRRDAGQTRQPETTLYEVAAMQREATRKNGKRILGTEDALSILEQSGREITVSTSRVNALLRARRLDKRGLAGADPATRMRSRHPNHVHQIDPSLCVIYYLKGRQYIMREEEFYKNKLENYARIQEKVWRYVRTDHASGVIDCKYYLAAGENQFNLFDFLCHTWGRQPGRTSHGAPRILIWDRGSANTATGVKRVLTALEIEHEPHQTEAPRTKGQVEDANNIIECKFESRLRVEPAESIDRLNDSVFRFCEAYNANTLPRIDSRLRRAGTRPVVRYDLWSRIRPEQIREMPDKRILGRLMEGRIEPRTITEQLYIEYKHPMGERSYVYDVRHCEGLQPKDKVQVSPLILSGRDIRVRFETHGGEEKTWRLSPITEYDEYGFPLDLPVWGEGYRSPPRTPADHNMDKLDEIAYPGRDAKAARQRQETPFEGALDAISHLHRIETPTRLPRNGARISVEAPEDIRPPVPLTRALMRLTEALGRPLTPKENKDLRERHPEGIPEEELARMEATEEKETTPRLRVVK